MSDSNSDNETDSITLPFARASKSKNACIICRAKNPLLVIPADAKLQVFVKRGLIMNGKPRCCKRHLKGSLFRAEELHRITQVEETTTFTTSELTKLLNDLRTYCDRGALDFDTPGALSDEDNFRLTGVVATDFNKLFAKVKNSIHSTKVRSARTSLAICLMKLRTGLSHTILSTLFRIPRRAIGKAIDSARKALVNDFVPHHLGLDHVSRQEFINNHSTDIAKKLFAEDDDTVAILVADGTYVYIQKSSNYSFQRRSFSMHKGRHLVKPMMIVSTTGYILDVFGPYLADGKNNDAQIMNSLIKQRGSELLEWVQPDDILIVDRGFRDSIETLEEHLLIPKMPRFLDKGSHQLDTLDANSSRLVTKIRWVVESVNGLMKTWKALGQVVPNTQIPYIRDYVRIVCAICNAFRPPRREASKPDDEVIAQRMLNLSSKDNTFQKYIQDNRWERKTVTIWDKVDGSSLQDFPRLTLSDLHRLTIGVYQLKQAASYTREHLAGSLAVDDDEDNHYIMYVHKEEDGVLRVKMQSRHTSSHQYQLWIRYTKEGFDPIQGWYCKCKNGSRVVGCCAHISSVLWYLGYYRHLPIKPKYHSDQYADFQVDAANWSESEASENEEQE